LAFSGLFRIGWADSDSGTEPLSSTGATIRVWIESEDTSFELAVTRSMFHDSVAATQHFPYSTEKSSSAVVCMLYPVETLLDFFWHFFCCGHSFYGRHIKESSSS
jgi:hypothetical protein